MVCSWTHQRRPERRLQSCTDHPSTPSPQCQRPDGHVNGVVLCGTDGAVLRCKMLPIQATLLTTHQRGTRILFKNTGHGSGEGEAWAPIKPCCMWPPLSPPCQAEEEALPRPVSGIGKSTRHMAPGTEAALSRSAWEGPACPSP